MKTELPLKNKKQESKKINSSLIISIGALLISIVSLYLQFFYEHHELKASLINSEITNDSINLDLIYQNSGNKDATIINSKIYFYSNKNEKVKKYHLEFINKENEEKNPLVISPGKQVFSKLTQKIYFNRKDLLKNNRTNTKDTIRIILKINYLNDNALQAESITKCGWLTLDSLCQIKHWSIDYQNIELNSKYYFARGYKFE